MTYTASSSFPLLVPHSFGFLSPLSRFIVNGSFYSALMLMKVWMTSFWVNKYWSDGPFIAWYHALIKKDNLWQGLMSVSNLNNKTCSSDMTPGSNPIGYGLRTTLPLSCEKIANWTALHYEMPKSNLDDPRSDSERLYCFWSAFERWLLLRRHFGIN